jgi:hypothetical protein
MNPEFPEREEPQWLAQLTDLKNLPIEQMLSGSLFYPSCGLDVDPVRYMGRRNIRSFIYVDYDVEHDQVIQTLHDPEEGFRGYNVTYWRDVTERELAPHGWKPIHPRPSDGKPPPPLQKPFAIWSIHDRLQGFDNAHGPSRFSLLYVGGEGVATFQALYHSSKIRPEVVAIIAPGHGCGKNWTNFEDPTKIFGRSVLSYNPAGKPDYVMCGYYHNGAEGGLTEACWPEYSQLIDSWRSHTHGLGLFRLGHSNSMEAHVSTQAETENPCDRDAGQKTGQTPDAAGTEAGGRPEPEDQRRRTKFKKPTRRDPLKPLKPIVLPPRKGGFYFFFPTERPDHDDTESTTDKT